MSLLTQIGVVFILWQKSLIYQGVIQIIVWCCWSYCLPLNMRLIILFLFFKVSGSLISPFKVSGSTLSTSLKMPHLSGIDAIF